MSSAIPVTAEQTWQAYQESIAGEQAWRVYQDITRVIRARYPVKYNPVPVSMALQRLGEAVLFHHNLNANDHPVDKVWILKLQHVHPGTLPLSTTEEMLHAKISEYEEEIPSQQAGHDSWTRGQTAGCKPQKSLQETLDRDYSEIKLIVDMTFDQAASIFIRIKGLAQIEIDRLSSKHSSEEKMSEIVNAVTYLAAAVMYKYKQPLTHQSTLSQKEKDYVDSIDLYSFNTMFDAKIKKWSLRQALNLSSDSLVSKIFGLHEALWGKTTTLQNVEKTL